MGRAELVASLAIPAGRLSNTTDAAFAIPAGPLARTAGLGGHCPILDVLSTTVCKLGWLGPSYVGYAAAAYV